MVQVMKKTLEKIAALAFVAAMGGMQPGCTTAVTKPSEADIETYIIQTIENRDEAVRKKLDDVLYSVYRFEVKGEYQPEGAPENSPKLVISFPANAFAFAYRDGYTYLATNAHIIIMALPDKKRQKSIKINPDLTITAGPEVVYKKISQQFKIPKENSQPPAAADIKLETVIVDKKLDIAILKAKNELYVSNKFLLDKNLEPRLGDEIFLLGYLGATDLPTSTKGNMPQVNLELLNKQKVDMLDVTSNFGNSGSPYFIRRGDKLYWAGIFTRIWPYNENCMPRVDCTPMVEWGIPIKDFIHLLDNAHLIVNRK